MSLALLAMGANLVAGGVKYFQGQSQAEEGREMELGLDKPEFRIPEEIAVNMSRTEKLEFQGLPEEQKRQFIENQQRAAQAALRSSSDRRGGLGMISQIQSTTDRTSADLLTRDVQAQRENMMMAMTARQTMADYKQQRFEHEYNEYAADLDYARAMQGAGMQNMQSGIMQGISGVGQGLASLAPAPPTNPDLLALLGQIDSNNTDDDTEEVVKKKITTSNDNSNNENILTSKKNLSNKILNPSFSTGLPGFNSGEVRTRGSLYNIHNATYDRNISGGLTKRVPMLPWENVTGYQKRIQYQSPESMYMYGRNYQPLYSGLKKKKIASPYWSELNY